MTSFTFLDDLQKFYIQAVDKKKDDSGLKHTFLAVQSRFNKMMQSQMQKAEETQEQHQFEIQNWMR